jgi:hypothetical protein
MFIVLSSLHILLTLVVVCLPRMVDGFLFEKEIPRNYAIGERYG